MLSGGAAHGLAHIGVLKFLEENNIEIDYVTGTSMGAVIGGLYSMGYTASQIEEIAASQEWDLIMSNDTPLKEIAPIEKRHHERIPISLYWNNDRFELPKALIRGQKLDVNLSNLFVPAHCIRSFDELHIPFRCVAIDIESGSIDVFSEGYLADAIRASMAIPSVFPPKEFNGRLYVDGGLIRNLPVQEALDMGADIIIASYVGGVKLDRDELSSMFDILQQSAFMAGILDAEEQSKLADVLIEPDVKRMGKFDFEDYGDFIEIGYDAANQLKDTLNSIKTLRNRYQIPPRNPRLVNSDSITIDYIELTANNASIERLISNKLKFSGGSSVSIQKLEESLSLIHGTRSFSKSYYTFLTDGPDVGLELVAENAEPFSIGLSINRFRRYNTSLILNAEARNVIGRMSNFMLDVRLSENSGIQAQYYIRLPWDPSYLIRAYSKLESYELPFINNDIIDRLYMYREADMRIELLKEWKNAYMFSVGYAFNFDRIKPEVFKPDDLKKYSSGRSTVVSAVSYNTLDKQLYPTEGLSSELSFNFIFSNTVKRENQDASNSFLDFADDDSYFQSHLSAQYYYPMGETLVLELNMRGRWSSGEAFLDQYKIGGPAQSKDYTYGFVGLEESEYLMGDHISAGLGMRFQIKNQFFITPTVQYLFGQDLLHYAYNRDKNISLTGLGIQVGMESPIGPISFDMGYTNYTNELNLNLGVGFRHIY